MLMSIKLCLYGINIVWKYPEKTFTNQTISSECVTTDRFLCPEKIAD